MAVPAVIAAAGAAALLYYTGFREPNSSRRRRHQALRTDEEDEDGQGSPKRVKRAPLSRFARLSRFFAERVPDRPPATCVEAAAMMANSIRLVCRETFGKWGFSDLVFGLAFVWRRRKQSDVGRVYAEDEASVQMSLSPERVPELQILRRLVSMCFCFARKTYNDLCRDFGYKPEEILIYEPKSRLLAPAFAVILDKPREWVLVLVRGTHSHKDRFTCATCVGVPFHHTVLTEEDGESDDELEYETGPGEDLDLGARQGREAGRVCGVCGVRRRRHLSTPEKGEKGEKEKLGGSPCSACSPPGAPFSPLAEGSCGDASSMLCGPTRSSRGVKQIVLGYAHCGMVAAARSMANRITGPLQEALQKNPGYVVKVVGHSLGGSTAAMLTFILREKEGLEDTTCIAFGPGASMTWDLAQSGQCCVTSVVNGADFVPTFSASAVDDLRAEVQRSAWANDLQEQLRKMRALRVILQTVAVLRRQLAVIRASTVAMSTKASRQLYVRLQTAASTRGMIMALRSVPRLQRGFLCFPAKRSSSALSASAAAAAAAGAGGKALVGEAGEGVVVMPWALCSRRPVLRMFQRACSSPWLLLARPAHQRQLQGAASVPLCHYCCPPALIPPTASAAAAVAAAAASSPIFCGRCKSRSSVPLLPPSDMKMHGSGTQGGPDAAKEARNGLAPNGVGTALSSEMAGYSAEEMDEWSHPLRAVDSNGPLRMLRDEHPPDAAAQQAPWAHPHSGLPHQVLEVGEDRGLVRTPSGSSLAGLQAAQAVPAWSAEGAMRRRFAEQRRGSASTDSLMDAWQDGGAARGSTPGSRAGTPRSGMKKAASGGGEDGFLKSEGFGAAEEPKDDAAAGLAALLEAMGEGGAQPGDEEGDASPLFAGVAELGGGGGREGREWSEEGCSWVEMSEKLQERVLVSEEEAAAAGMSPEEASVVEGIMREEEALEEALQEEREQARRSLGAYAEEGEDEDEEDGGGAEGDGLEGSEALEGAGLLRIGGAGQEGEEEDEEEEDDSDGESEEEDETRDPRRWYPCGRVIHLVWNTWDELPEAEGAPRGATSCDCTGMGCHTRGDGVCSLAGAAAPESQRPWRVGMFEVDRRLYGRIKLSGSMVSDHLMANYVKSFEGLIQESEKEGLDRARAPGASPPAHALAYSKQLECGMMTCG